jgi:hypothetical protein
MGSFFYWVTSFYIQLILYILLHVTRNREILKNNLTKMAKTKIIPRPKIAKPLANTNPTPAKTAKTVTIATTGTTEMKKGGRYPDNEAV